MHLFSDLSNWMKVLCSISVVANLNSSNHLKSFKSKVKWTIIVLIGLISMNLINFICIERVPIQLTPTHNATYVCAIQNLKILFLRDLMDFMLYFLIPFLLMTFLVYLILKLSNNSIININKRQKKLKKMMFKIKCAPVLFGFFYLPILILCGLCNYLKVSLNESIFLSIFCLIVFSLNQLNLTLNLIYNIYYNKKLRINNRPLILTI